MIQHPTEKFIDMLKRSLTDSDHKEHIVDSLYKLTEWTVMEFGGRWMDLDISESELKW